MPFGGSICRRCRRLLGSALEVDRLVDAAAPLVVRDLRIGTERTGTCHFLASITAAVIESGAAMLTVHARLRCQPYSHPATWGWLSLAREERDRHARRIPLIGNGGVEQPIDVQRLLTETGCDGVMIGRAALADPSTRRQ